MKPSPNRMKGRLEIVAINLDSISEWQAHEWSKKIVWKNWNDGKKFKQGGIKSHYYDFNAVPFYVLLSPDGRILWEMAGYGTGCFLGIAEALNGPKQDNYDNPNLAIRKVDAGNKGTTISFRYYTEKGFWFNIAHDSYLTANGKKYKLTAADGIALDENITTVATSRSPSSRSTPSPPPSTSRRAMARMYSSSEMFPLNNKELEI